MSKHIKYTLKYRLYNIDEVECYNTIKGLYNRVKELTDDIDYSVKKLQIFETLDVTNDVLKEIKNYNNDIQKH